VFYLTKNPIVNEVDHYRKYLIHKLKNLSFLDDKPVSAEDKRFAKVSQCFSV